MTIDGPRTSSPIPQILVFEILKELPVKTLIRFKVVSKLWCSIIDDPIFVDSHRTRSHTRTGGISILCQHLQNNGRLKIYSTDPEGESPVPFLNLPDGILDIFCYEEDYRNWDEDLPSLQSVNGLICRKYCIWNPSTRESIDLPPIRVNITSQFDVRGANLGRCNIFPRNLLGFDSVSKQYKVVNMCDISFGQIWRLEFRILTLGRDSYWRNLDSVPEKLGFRTGLGVCCVDDVIFCSGWVDDTEVIVAFEVGPEQFKVISLPDGVDAISMDGNIIQVGGRLGLMDFDFARAGEVNVDKLTSVNCVKVVESLDYAEAGYVDQATNSDGDVYNRIKEVMVMNIWILEDYHKLQWKKEVFTYPSWRYKNYGVKTSIMATPMGSIHTTEILLCFQGQERNLDSIFICSYYELESKSLRIVPKVTEQSRRVREALRNRFKAIPHSPPCLPRDSGSLNAVGMHLMKVKEALRCLAELTIAAHAVYVFPKTMVGQRARSSLGKLRSLSSTIYYA
ncbi:hypothetical protein LguiA_029081 [Lonicera macranthoides]